MSKDIQVTLKVLCNSSSLTQIIEYMLKCLQKHNGKFCGSVFQGWK